MISKAMDHTTGYPLYTVENRAHAMEVLAGAIHELNRKWWTNIVTDEPLDRNVGELLMLAVSELSEAMEGDRKNMKDDKLPQYDMLDVELVDCVIRSLDFLAARKAPIADILIAKTRFNYVRPDHQKEHRLSDHGKKY